MFSTNLDMVGLKPDFINAMDGDVLHDIEFDPANDC